MNYLTVVTYPTIEYTDKIKKYTEKEVGAIGEDKLLKSEDFSSSSVGNASSGNLGGLNNVMFA